MNGGLEPGYELAAEHAAEHFDRQEEAAGGTDLSSMVRRHPASSHNAVSMLVKL